MVGGNDVAYERGERGRRRQRPQERPTERRQGETPPVPGSIDDTVTQGGGGGTGQQPGKPDGVAYFLPPAMGSMEYGPVGRVERGYAAHARLY